MNRLGMMIDISHVSEQAMLDAMRASRAPVIFSHSSAYGPCKHRRNVKDNVLYKLVRQINEYEVIMSRNYSVHIILERKRWCLNA